MLLLLDSNLLTLYVAGRTDRRIIAAHKRLQVYDDSDYEWLCRFIASYDGVLLTPNTVTEASNLPSQIADPYRTRLRRELKAVNLSCFETYVRSASASDHRDFAWLGLTDAVILTILQDKVAGLTADLDLFRAAFALGLNMISYTNTRYVD